MKLAFDAESILPLNHSGIGWCAINLMRAVAGMAGEDSLRLQYFIPRREYDTATISRLEALGYKQVTSNFHGTLYKMIWRFIPLGYSRFFGASDATCFFNFHLPPGVKGRKIVFVHDMTYRVFPETMNWKTLYMLRLNMRYTIRHADKIIAVSQFTKDEIRKYYGVPAERIEVVYNGVDIDRFHGDYTEDDINAVKAKHNITRPYFLYLGTLEPRKNIEGMLDAYSLLKKDMDNPPAFVFAGSKGWRYDGIFQRVRELGLEDDVIFTGYVDADDSPPLINGAVAFIFVSLYEGFGIPALEAMACGTPVLTSNLASLPEATGGRSLYADPYDPRDIASKMKSLSEDALLRHRLSSEGIPWARDFTWERSAKKLLDIMRDV